MVFGEEIGRGKKPTKTGIKSCLFGIIWDFFAFSGLDSDQAQCGFWSLAALGKTQGKNKKQEKKRKKKEIYIKYINI